MIVTGTHEIYFQYDKSWPDTEVLHLVQIIQRILGLEESLSIKHTEKCEVAIPVQASSDREAQKLLDKIFDVVIMVEPYVLGCRRLESV